MNQTSPLRAIVFSKRKELRQSLRNTLQQLGFVKVSMETESHSAKNALLNDLDAFLVLDWMLGEQENVSVLETSRSKLKIDTRPTVIFSPEVTNYLVSISREYNVAQIVIGEITPGLIKDRMTKMLKIEKPMHSVRRLLKQVGVHRKKNNWQEATRLLEEMYRKTKGSQQILVEYCENLAHENQWEKVEALLAPQVDKKPENPRLIHLYSKCLMRKGRFEDASKALEKARFLNPNNIDRLIDLGDALFSNYEIDKASEAFQEAKDKEPNNVRANKGIGKCMLMQGDLDDALNLLRNSTNERQVASIFNTAAIVCMKNAKFDKGMRLYEKAVNAVKGDDQTMSKLLFNTGLGYRRWNKPQKALKFFEDSVKLDGEFEKAQEFVKSTEKILLDRGIETEFREERVENTAGYVTGKLEDSEGPGAFNIEAFDSAIEQIEDEFSSEDEYGMDDNKDISFV